MPQLGLKAASTDGNPAQRSSFFADMQRKRLDARLNGTSLADYVVRDVNPSKAARKPTKPSTAVGGRKFQRKAREMVVRRPTTVAELREKVSLWQQEEERQYRVRSRRKLGAASDCMSLSIRYAVRRAEILAQNGNDTMDQAILDLTLDCVKEVSSNVGDSMGSFLRELSASLETFIFAAEKAETHLRKKSRQTMVKPGHTSTMMTPRSIVGSFVKTKDDTSLPLSLRSKYGVIEKVIGEEKSRHVQICLSSGDVELVPASAVHILRGDGGNREVLHSSTFGWQGQRRTYSDMFRKERENVAALTSKVADLEAKIEMHRLKREEARNEIAQLRIEMERSLNDVRDEQQSAANAAAVAAKAKAQEEKSRKQALNLLQQFTELSIEANATKRENMRENDRLRINLLEARESARAHESAVQALSAQLQRLEKPDTKSVVNKLNQEVVDLRRALVAQKGAYQALMKKYNTEIQSRSSPRLRISENDEDGKRTNRFTFLVGPGKSDKSVPPKQRWHGRVYSGVPGAKEVLQFTRAIWAAYREEHKDNAISILANIAIGPRHYFASWIANYVAKWMPEFVRLQRRWLADAARRQGHENEGAAVDSIPTRQIVYYLIANMRKEMRVHAYSRSEVCLLSHVLEGHVHESAILDQDFLLESIHMLCEDLDKDAGGLVAIDDLEDALDEVLPLLGTHDLVLLGEALREDADHTSGTSSGDELGIVEAANDDADRITVPYGIFFDKTRKASDAPSRFRTMLLDLHVGCAMEFNRDLRHEMYTEAVVDGNTNEMYLSRLALQRAIRSCDPERSETSVAQLSTALVLASSTTSVGSIDPSSSLPSASPSPASLSSGQSSHAEDIAAAKAMTAGTHDDALIPLDALCEALHKTFLRRYAWWRRPKRLKRRVKRVMLLSLSKKHKGNRKLDAGENKIK